MKKLSFFKVASLSALLSISAGYAANAVPVNTGKAVKSNENAQNASASAKEANFVRSVVDEVSAAAAAGNEQLVTKILAEAIKNNPALAGKIVEAFVASQTVPAESTKPATINVSNVINSVITNFQGQQNGDAVVASILSAYTPAAGGPNRGGQNNPNAQGGNNSKPQLPKAGKLGANNGNGAPPPVNQNHTSGN